MKVKVVNVLAAPFRAAAGAALLFCITLPGGIDVEAAITLRGATQNGIDTVPPSTISHEGTGTSAAITGCGDINPSIPAGSAGDLLIAQAIAKETDGGNTVSMNGWNTYYSDADASGGDNNELQIYIFWRIATGGDPNTITQSGTFCNAFGGQISRFSGVDTSSPFETTNPGVVFQDSGDLDTGTITTTSATAMLLVGGFISDDRNVTEGAGWNESYDFDYNDGGAEPDFGLSLHFQAQTTAGNKNISNWGFTQGGNDENFGVIYALTPASSTAGLTINVPAGTTTDDVMVAAISVRPSTIAITPPAGWTSLNRVDQPAGNSNAQEIFYRVATGSEPANYTWSFSGPIGGAAGGIISYIGVDTGNPIDAFGGNTTPNGTTHTADSITTTVADTMVVSSHSFSSAETWTPPTGMTERVDVASIATPQAGGISLEMNDVTQAGAGATGDKTATAGGSADTGVAQLAALRPDPDAPSTCDFNNGLASGLPGDYFDNMTLTDPPAGTRVDGPIDFNWGTGTPGVSGIGSDQFSVRWEGTLRVTSSDIYRFQTESDDGVRLWVDGNLIIDNWTDHAPTTDTSGDVSLSAGQLYDVRLEYYENGGGSVIRLRWGRSSGGFSYSPIPAGPSPTFDEGLYHCPLVPVPDPQAEFRMDEANWDGTAGEVTDETGNGFDGTSQNGANTDAANPAIAGDPGTCGYGDFDGTDDYVDVGGLSGILNRTASLAFWINTTQIGNDTQWQAPGVTGVEESGGADDIFWGWIDASGNIGISVGDDIDEEQKSTSVVNDGSWHHVVLTRDAASGATKVYVDGNLESTGTTGTGIIGNSFTSIGRIEDTGGSPEYFDGLLDEVRIYDAVLDDSQVTAIMDDTHPCPSAAGRMEVDSVTMNDTTVTPAFTPVTFNQTYNTPPLVFVLPTNEGPDPSAIRIRNVTTTGFEMAQVEPANQDGPHPAMTVHYLAIEEGTLTLPDGRTLEAGSISTTNEQKGPGVGGATGWDTVTFNTAFSGTPAVLAQVQSMNNESGNPPSAVSSPWLVTAMQNVTASDMELALERAEVDDISPPNIGSNETIGYLAVEGGVQGSFVSGSATILYESIVSADNIAGWDNNNCAAGNGDTVNFVNTYSTPPLVIATQNRRDGNNGGWVRRCGPVAVDHVRLSIDEDQYNDSERNHTPEAAGLLVFSEAFCLPACNIAVLDHYDISHDGSGVTCLSEEMTITATDTDGNTVDPGNVTIDLSVAPVSGDSVVPPAKGDWVRVTSGTGTLNDGTAGDGAATYTFPGDGTSSVTLVFNYTAFETGNTTETINFNVDDTTNGITDTRDGDPGSDPDMTFSLTGLQFYNVTDGNTTVPVQIGGKPSDEAPNAAVIALRAVRTSDENAAVCEPAFPAMSTVSVPLGVECLNPAACGSQQMSVTNNGNTTAVATNVDNGGAGTSAYTPVSLLFEDAGGGMTEAYLVLNYPDVGEMQMHGRYEIPLDEGGSPPTGAPSGGFMVGATNPFVVRPFGIAVTNIVAGATSNPGSLTPGGALFTAAGSDFAAAVGAYLWQEADDDGVPFGTADDGIPDFQVSGGIINGVDITDNGLAESFAWNLALSPSHYEPTPGGSAGTLNNGGITAAEFSGGQATINDLQYMEAGAIALLSVTNNYLGTSELILGLSSFDGSDGAVGRFGADHFTFVSNTPELGPACGSFTYVDQPFDYTTAPQITARAMAADGSTVLSNYSDFTGSGGANWWLLDQAAGVTPGYTDLASPTDITLDTAAAGYSPNSGRTGSNGTQTFTLNGPFAYAKDTPPISEQAPFNGDLRLDFTVTDDDGATGTFMVNPVTFNNPEQRWGRLTLMNAGGSELLPVTIPIRTEYWNGNNYVLNTDDNCTVIENLDDDIVLTNPDTAGGAPQSGDTSMTINDGNTQITSGAPTLSSGEDAITFSAPGEGNTGFVDMEINLAVDGGSGGSDDPWLQYDWNGDGNFDENPAGRATFGIYRGADELIYTREPWN